MLPATPSRRRQDCSTSDACEGGNSEESPPRRIYGRVCGWRAMQAVSLGHLGSQSFLARVRAEAEVSASPRLAFMVT